MVKVLFICHGNICRSPMAEYLLREMVRRQGLAAQFQIASAATNASTSSASAAHRHSVRSAP